MSGRLQIEVYPDYFERQKEARCGMHALNNAVGLPLHDANDMTRACEIYLHEIAVEGVREPRCWHEGPGGWYSSEVMAKAVTSTCMSKLGRVEHVMQLEPLHVNPDALRGSLGGVVNKRNEHWVALRWCKETVWLLDSMEPRPQSLTWSEYVDFVNRHKDAYRIEMAPAATSSGERRGAVAGGQPGSRDARGAGPSVLRMVQGALTPATLSLYGKDHVQCVLRQAACIDAEEREGKAQGGKLEPATSSGSGRVPDAVIERRQASVRGAMSVGRQPGGVRVHAAEDVDLGRQLVEAVDIGVPAAPLIQEAADPCPQGNEVVEVEMEMESL